MAPGQGWLRLGGSSVGAHHPALADEIAQLHALGRRLPRPLVFTNGVFDLLHAGHADGFAQARRLGASLVVGVNGDASARRLEKGPGRPFNREHDRAALVAALAAVSAVVVFDEDAPLTLLRILRPEIYVKGGDYEVERLPEAALVASWGARTVIVPRRITLSTSSLVEAILHAAEAGRSTAGSNTSNTSNTPDKAYA